MDGSAQELGYVVTAKHAPHRQTERGLGEGSPPFPRRARRKAGHISCHPKTLSALRRREGLPWWRSG